MFGLSNIKEFIWDHFLFLCPVFFFISFSGASFLIIKANIDHDGKIQGIEKILLAHNTTMLKKLVLIFIVYHPSLFSLPIIHKCFK